MAFEPEQYQIAGVKIDPKVAWICLIGGEGQVCNRVFREYVDFTANTQSRPSSRGGRPIASWLCFNILLNPSTA